MRIIRFMTAFAVCLGFFALASGGAFAAVDSNAAVKIGTINWTISFKPQLKKVDLFLTDRVSGKDVLNAKLKAIITLPSGVRVEKEMKMTPVKKTKVKTKTKAKTNNVSYTCPLDMSAPGPYIFDITGKSGKRDIQIHVNYVVKSAQAVK